MATDDTYVRTAIKDGGITRLDARGLMPLDEARAWLATRDRYAKGDFIDNVAGQAILESDRTWAALMSLLDAEEFLAQTRRLSWEFEVRGMENLAPLQRYGDAVVRWVADRVDADGTLHNRPWCLLPCLLACAAPAAFDIAVRVRSVSGSAEMAHAASVATRWVLRHPEPGYRLAAAHPQVVEELFSLDPRGTRTALAAALGAAAADELLATLDLHEEPLPDEVRQLLDDAPALELPASTPVPLGELDEAFASFDVPIWDNANYFCAGMRLTGFVVPGGQDGLVFQAVMTGLGNAGAELMLTTIGFDERPRVRWGLGPELISEAVAEQLRGAEIWELDLPNGHVQVQPAPHPEFGAELGRMETVMLAITAEAALRDRAYLRPDQLVTRLGLPERAEALYTLDRWHHPNAAEAGTSSVDLVLAVEALRERRAISRTVTQRDRDPHLRERMEIIGGWGSWSDS